eukprot:s290_g18.t1
MTLLDRHMEVVIVAGLPIIEYNYLFLRIPPPAPAWRDVVLIADFSEISHLADENWNFSAMHPLNHVPLTMMEEKALWQYTRFFYAKQVDTYTFDHLLSGVAERIEEQWQISLNPDDLEIRYDENNGLKVFQVTPDQPFWNLRNLLDQYRPQWQTHKWNISSSSSLEIGIQLSAWAITGVNTMGWTLYQLIQSRTPLLQCQHLPGRKHWIRLAQLMTVLRNLPPADSPEQHRSQLLALVQDSEVLNEFTSVDLNTLATHIHQLADLVSAAQALPMEVHLTDEDASL